MTTPKLAFRDTLKQIPLSFLFAGRIQILIDKSLLSWLWKVARIKFWHVHVWKSFSALWQHSTFKALHENLKLFRLIRFFEKALWWRCKKMQSVIVICSINYQKKKNMQERKFETNSMKICESNLSVLWLLMHKREI